MSEETLQARAQNAFDMFNYNQELGEAHLGTAGVLLDLIRDLIIEINTSAMPAQQPDSDLVEEARSSIKIILMTDKLICPICKMGIYEQGGSGHCVTGHNFPIEMALTATSSDAKQPDSDLSKAGWTGENKIAALTPKPNTVSIAREFVEYADMIIGEAIKADHLSPRRAGKTYRRKMKLLAKQALEEQDE